MRIGKKTFCNQLLNDKLYIICQFYVQYQRNEPFFQIVEQLILRKLGRVKYLARGDFLGHKIS